MTFIVRPFTPGDIAAVRALWATCDGLGDGPGDSEEGLTRFLARNPGHSMIALADDQVVGAALCGHDGRRGFLYRVAVAPGHRRRGIAQELVARGLASLRADGLERGMLFVLAENEGAKRFWRSMGGRLRAQLQIWSVDL